MTKTATAAATDDRIELVPVTNNVISQVSHPPHIENDSEAAVAGCGPDPNARPAAFRSLAHEILFVLTATMSIAMPSFLQGSILIVVAASSLTSGSFLLFFGKVADLLGRRSILLTSLFLFALIALATGFARNAAALIVLNAVMALTSASIIPSAQGILGSIYERPSRRKNYAFACFSSGNHLGFAVSAVFPGVASQVAGWPASFWLLAVMYAAVAIIACFTVPPDDTEKLPFNRECSDVFIPILDLSGTELTDLKQNTSVGPDSPQGWRTPYIIVFLVLGPVLLLAGRLLHIVSNKLLMGIGAAGFTISFLLVAVQRSGASYWAFTFPAFVIVVFGTDFEFNVVNMYVVSSLPKSQQSIASSVFQTTIKLATVLGLGICAALFASVAERPARSGYYAGDPFEPYAALFWFAAAVSFVSLLIVPLLHIKTQGHIKKA
ncbi:major facilitator superfamily MFS-1 [Apiospora hydei]|uniref:Major facilitator superfamily MFS-1 n=1 Tax=Apiospora hydei TaxID=1337664 RepID=A0ABR1WBB7_9PEZI